MNWKRTLMVPLFQGKGSAMERETSALSAQLTVEYVSTEGV